MGKQRLGQAFVSAGATTRGHSRSAADCIGRVGGLAAALGVGAMLFVAPWTAAAETEGASSSESSATSEPDSTESTDSSDEGADAGDSDTSGSSDDGSDDDTDAESEADELDAELSDEIADELEEDPDDEGASSSGDDDAEAVAAEEAVDIADTFVDEMDDEMDDVVVGSGGSNVVVETDTAAPGVVADEPEPVIEDEPSEDPQGVSSLDAGITSTEPASSRSSYTSASVMAARTSIEEITEPPAKALQAQPGTFLEVASSMLSAVIAPFVTTPATPAAPSAQPLMWGVLSWVRRELDDTFANFSISIGGRQIVQNGTAYATSQGFGSFAIAHGENAVASASGLFNVAIVRGDDSTATSEGNFTRVRVRGDDNTAGASGPGSRATVYGDDNTAETTGASSSIYVRGVGNEATSSGSGNSATVYGDGNEVVLASQDGSARARVVGDRNTATSVSEDGRTRVSVVGDDNDATALATNGSRAEITVRGDENSAAASADEDSTARVSIIGDGSTAVADADTDGYAAARITGDSNVASSEAVDNTSIAKIVGDGNAASGNAMLARAEASIVGDGNAAEANDGKAVISGDSSSATADGPGSLARVWGDTSVASALGEDNTAFVWGNESRALAGPGTGNNALAFGNNLLADTGPGDGRTVYGQPFDPENQAPVAGAPGAQTVDPETGTVTGTLGFTDPDGDTLTYTATDPTNGSVTINAQAGTYTYTPATRPDFGEPDGADAFTVTASDGQATAMATIDVPVTALPEPGNQAPVAGTPGEQTVDPETGSVTGTLGFTDPDGDDLSYTATAPANGSVTVNPDGTYTYTPATRPPFGDPDGTDAFTVTATDPDGLSAATTISVPVTAVPSPGNTAPVAAADSYTVDQDGTLVVAGPGVLGNDTDAESDALTATLGDGPVNGTLTLNTDGSFTYTPDTGYTGIDTFTYTATDGDLTSGTATVTITVNAVTTDPPNTVIGTVDVGENPNAVSVTPDGTRVYVVNGGNLFNEDNASVTVIDVSDPANPTVLQTIPFDIYNPQEIEISPDGLRAYVAYDNVVGGNGHLLVIDTDPASTTYNTVIGDPIEVGDGPTDIEFTPDGTRAIILNQSSLDVVILDTDPTSATFHTLIGTPIRVANSSPRALALTPLGSHAYITIPRSGADTVVVLDINPDSAGYGTLIGDPIAVGDSPNDIEIAPNGARAYVVNAGDDTVSVIDTNPLSATYNTVIGNPIPVGDLPQALAFTPDGTRAYVANGFDGEVVVIDTDPGSITFNFVIGDPISVGARPDALAVSDDGTHLYVVNDNDETVSVIYLGPPSAPYNTAPSAGEDTFITNENTAVTGDVLANDFDFDGDTLTAELITGPGNGVLSLSADGTFTYTPSAGFAGADSFTYAVSDGALSDTATATITVNAVGGDPVALGTVELPGELVGPLVIGADGLAYQTTETDGAVYVTVVDPSDPTSATTVELPGSATDAVQFGTDGTAYQISTAGDVTHVAVINPADLADATILEVPGNFEYTVFDGDTAYLVTGTGSTTTYVTVIDPTDPTNAVTVDLTGEPADPLVIGPDGLAYQTTRSISGGQDVTHVSVIDPANPAGAITIELPGFSPEPVVFGPGGGYQTSYSGSFSSGYLTHVTKFDLGTLANPTTIDLSEDPDGPVVFGPDGTGYQLHGDFSRSYVTLIDPQDFTNPVTITLTGYRTEEVTFSDTGDAYVTSRTGTTTTHVTVIDPTDPTNRTVIALPGTHDEPVGFFPDGTAYQFSETRTPGTDEYVTHLTVIDPADLTNHTTVDLAGEQILTRVIAVDGTIYQRLRTIDTSGDEFFHVAVIDPTNPTDPTVIDLPGYPVGELLTGDDGTLYQTSYGGVTSLYTVHVTIIDPEDPANPATVERTQYDPFFEYSLTRPYDPGLRVGADGTAYLTNTATDVDGIDYPSATRVTVIDPADPENAVTLDVAGNPDGAVVIAPDGTAYQTVGTNNREFIPTWFTHVVVIDPEDPTNPVVVDLLGQAVGPVTIGADGVVYQLTETVEDGVRNRQLTTIGVAGTAIDV